MRLRELCELAERDGLDDEEGRGWMSYLEDLAAMSGEDMAADLAECTRDGADYGVGWFEDTHGGAVFVPYR